MSITELSVKRPSSVIIFIVLIVGLGILGYFNMGADLMPSVNIPVITVSVNYAGAGAEDIRQQIVKPVESAVSGISGIDTITSSARQGSGRTTITFTGSTDMNSALMDVQKAVDRLSARLPAAADKPVLFKLDINAQAVLTLSLTGNVPFEVLYDNATDIQDKLQNIEGVGNVTLDGGRVKQLSIAIDKAAMDFYGVSLNTLQGKITANNSNVPVGSIKQDKASISVRYIGQFQNPEEVKNLLIPTKGNGNIRLGDLARVSLEYPPIQQILRLNGEQTIGIRIQKQSDANVVEVVNRVKSQIDEIKSSVSNNINITVANDSTVFIKQSLNGVKDNLFEGIITTCIVLYLFLRSWRSSMIVLVAIPTSLLGALLCMYIMKFTINMMSLMALSLCIGILVDDSIVVLENIQRHLGMGKSRITAAIEGRKEIGMAAIAITLCDVVVFAPIAFVGGTTGQIFRQFGLTIVAATLFSLLVSFTVTPMLCALFAKTEEKKEKEIAPALEEAPLQIDGENITPEDITQPKKKKLRFYNGLYERTLNKYRDFLIWSLDHRKRIIIIFTIGLLGSIALLPLGAIKSEYMPQTDQGALSINLRLQPGSSLDQCDQKVKLLEKYLTSLKADGVIYFYTTVGSDGNFSSASSQVKLSDRSKRKLSQSEIANKIRGWSRSLTGVQLSINEAQMGGGGGRSGSGTPIQLNIEGDNIAVVDQIADKVEELISSVAGTADVNNSTKNKLNEIRVIVNRLAANNYGISQSDVTSLLRMAIQGSTVGTYTEGGSEFDIVLKYNDAGGATGQIKTQADLGNIRITTASGQQVFLSQVATISNYAAPQSISRMDRMDTQTVSANIQPGYVLGDITKQVNKLIAEQIALPFGYKIVPGGSQQQQTDSFKALGYALLASFVLVYMVLVVLYNSFLTPLIRMLSLPCAAIGAILILAITGKTLNMTSYIGLIMLDGLASKNGTLLIDYTNTLLKRGMSLREALIESGTTRLRPIIMTSATMIVGMVPAALSLGEGSEMKVSMALVIIGGMIASTVFTPILLPVVYTIFDDLKHKRLRKKQNTIITEVQG